MRRLWKKRREGLGRPEEEQQVPPVSLALARRNDKGDSSPPVSLRLDWEISKSSHHGGHGGTQGKAKLWIFELQGLGTKS